MNLNKLYSTILFLLVIISLLSCSDFLDRNPLDELSNETFWTSEDEVELALTGCYSRLNDEPWFGYRRSYLDALTDNAQCKFNNDEFGYILSISRGVITTTTGGIIDDIWASSYAGISTCNNFLDNIDKAPLSESTKLQYIGEVRFLRAFFYSELVQYFGDAIIYKSCPETVEESKIAKSDKAELLTFIYEDLDFAISNLPNEKYSEGHAVKASAMALKARVYLLEEKFDEAATLTYSIIESGTFGLYSNYQDIFLANGQENNKEILFSTKYYGDDYSDMDAEIILWGSIMPRQELVSEYECTDGLPVSESPLYNANEPYANRDPRLAMTILTEKDTIFNPDGTIFSPDPTNTGFFQLKYVDMGELPITTSTRSVQDMVIIRYADVLLMYAEAKNEVSGPDQTIYDAINEIRGRVSMPNIKTGLTQDEMRNTIRHERRIELALEGLRYYDLKRWKTAHIIMPQVTDVGGASIIFENPKHYFWPYQQTELELNSNLVQNPDYK